MKTIKTFYLSLNISIALSGVAFLPSCSAKKVEVNSRDSTNSKKEKQSKLEEII